MDSVAFFNNKGGVGKTTLICNVAAYLALKHELKILVVDVDPQCNSTQLMLSESEVIDLYERSKRFTIQSIIHPLSIGRGYSEEIAPLTVENFGVELIPGDPKLALKEDLLSKDWQDAITGSVRGLRTTFVFAELLERCNNYDLVLFDMGPSLGSINRAVLVACDYFVSPMSIDIFSIKAIENISTALRSWKEELQFGIGRAEKAEEDALSDIPNLNSFDIEFIGYVAQQYIQKTTRGEKRVVDSYERIMKKIPKTISDHFVKRLGSSSRRMNFDIGSIPNLHSLIPMSQSARKPVFELKAKDGVRGAHFNKVRESEAIFGGVADRLLENLGYE